MSIKKISILILTLVFVFPLFVPEAVQADPKKHKSGKAHGKGHGKGQKNRGPQATGRSGNSGEGIRGATVITTPAEETWWRNMRTDTRDGRISIPPGHRPPPGMCRVWYPSVPPGQQPAPVSCSSIRRDRDAYLLYGDLGYDPAYNWNLPDTGTLRDIPHDFLDTLLNKVGVR